MNDGADGGPLPVLVVLPTAPLRLLAGSAVEAALRRTGRSARLLEAASGVDALWLLARSRPALAVVGLDLPGLTGEELVAQLRARPEHESLPVVAVADAGEEASERARRAGAAALLTVPLDVEAVDAALRAAGFGGAA